MFLVADRSFGQQIEIGVVRTVDGDARILRSGAEVHPAVGDSVLAGDVLLTGETGSMGVAMSDNAVLSIGPMSEFHLVEFEFDPRNTLYGFVARVLIGTFVYVSGDIGRLAPDTVVIETPIGRIGIRGTRFAGSISP